ncbi:MAG: hypothetical protein K6F62_06450 [Schwartzia sp.]|nr:hypothetical protein [Schwartzia sp. (in: firmicutes)]
MTELKIMQLAKECPDKPARGIDRLTGREVPEGEVFSRKAKLRTSGTQIVPDVRSFLIHLYLC